MNEKLMESLTNPIKNKLLMAVKAQGRATTKELAKSAQDIPQATLYRYLRTMVDDGLLEVVHENQIRNLREKVYGLAFDYDAKIEEINEDTTGRVYIAAFKHFINGLVEEFDKNTPKDNEIAVYDGSGFSSTPFYATYPEVQEISRQIEELIRPYENSPAPDRQLRSLATIYTPPTKDK
jgi:DNA-binding PadR family transcriptional regulator